MLTGRMENWRTLYPFEPKELLTPDGFRQSYLDEGEGFPVVMLHGIPTWSFMYRGLVRDLSKDRRCIAPDNIGCGLSEKPQHWTYRLEGHVRNLEHLLDNQLAVDQMDLVLHDWGGPIGMGYAVKHPEKIRRIVLMNTVAFLSNDVPWGIHLVRAPLLGALLVRGCNLLVRTAMHRAVNRPLPSDVAAGYAFPYGNWHDRIATQRFAQDIPFDNRHPSYPTFLHIQEKLHLLADRKILICWGDRDFCFPPRFLDRWKAFFPDAEIRHFPDASHYLLEDEPNDVMRLIRCFLVSI